MQPAKLRVYPPASDNVQHGLEVVLAGAYDVPLKLDRPTILDIGAHVGSASVRFAQQYPGAKIIAFEPSPENAGYARQNLEGVADLLEYAVVGDNTPDEVTLYDGQQNTGQRSLYQLGEQKPTGVKVRTYRASTLPPCDIMKLDCEGSEIPVLRAYPHLAGVKALMLEWHRLEDYHELLRWLPELGFELRSDLAKGNREAWDRNLIFTRKPAATPTNYDGSVQGLKGEYDLESMPKLQGPIKVLDIGANQGNFAKYVLSLHPDAAIWCFEPHPDTFAKACANLGDKATVIQAAVTHPERGMVRLYEGVNGSEECSLRDDVRWPHVSQRLDKFVEVPSYDAGRLPPCDLLKCDTEGSEVEILEGYRHLSSVRHLLVECHPVGGDLRGQMHKVLALAEAAGLPCIDVRGTVMRFARKGQPQAPALQALTPADLQPQPAGAERWERIETTAGTWRMGNVREDLGAVLVLNPCYFIGPERMIVPVPQPGGPLGATTIDFSAVPAWGDGSEQQVVWSSRCKLSKEQADKMIVSKS